jgi:hypothetical protein
MNYANLIKRGIKGEKKQYKLIRKRPKTKRGFKKWSKQYWKNVFDFSFLDDL